MCGVHPLAPASFQVYVCESDGNPWSIASRFCPISNPIYRLNTIFNHTTMRQHFVGTDEEQ